MEIHSTLGCYISIIGIWYMFECLANLAPSTLNGQKMIIGKERGKKNNFLICTDKLGCNVASVKFHGIIAVTTERFLCCLSVRLFV